MLSTPVYLSHAMLVLLDQDQMRAKECNDDRDAQILLSC